MSATEEELPRDLGAKAWRPVVEKLRAFVAGKVPPEDAADVAQNLLLRLHRGIDGLRDAAKAESWAYSIARRTIADYYRNRMPTEHLGDEVDGIAAGSTEIPPGFGHFEGDHSAHEEVLRWLRPAAEALPPMYRDPLIMADFEGYTQQEVADELGLSLPGAKSRVQRARVKLGEVLQSCCEIALGADGQVVDFRRRGCDC